ncbi:MAG: signal peptidase II [Phycisphaerales bacterium]|nr:signal peptidase II [Phycisphaerales bacterium]
MAASPIESPANVDSAPPPTNAAASPPAAVRADAAVSDGGTGAIVTGGPDAAAVYIEPTCWAHPGAHARFWLFAVFGLVLDLWSKHVVFHWLRQGGEPVTLIPHVLSFTTMFNPGALFGIGAGRTSVFLGASALALVLVVWMFLNSSPRRAILQIALGGILAGALGNMYDRINVQLVRLDMHEQRRFYEREDQEDRIVLREYPAAEGGATLSLPPGAPIDAPIGHVRDFIKINSTFFGREIWPWVFNVADMLLVGGVGILIWHMWRDSRRPAPG